MYRKAYLLENSIQHYSWGSSREIPGFMQIENPDGRPWAEVWMGVHPRGRSKLHIGDRKIYLDSFIAENPESVLGKRIAGKFGESLPFLFKLLSAGSPLSIQAHPNLEQAEKGYEREEREGIPREASSRNYRDQNHKPEIICALKKFTALRGFRTVDDILEDLESIPSAAQAVEFLKSGDLAEAFRRIMKSSSQEIEILITEARELAHSKKGSGKRFEWFLRLEDAYPNDVGVLSPFLLNLVELEPGQAMFLPAGELHAYLEGFGIELMANSDNVLRGGLTGKHMDVDELLSVLTFRAGEPDILFPVSGSAGVSCYPAMTDEFQLCRVECEGGGSVWNTQDSIALFVCTRGSLGVEAPEGGVELSQGESCVIPAAAGEVHIRGEGSLHAAWIPGKAGVNTEQ
ncbi:MAG: mannose-6-phosphate isomerase, class I [Spirochaetales bacterium]|nr:mannose-6-phosphate isomerase, class I [Spirochaetales bacterium]MCF7938028.1 mannose-6-phosphate isomerase, class I [Spirochaetales bacterium]